jgi:hypothetical protein
MKISTLVLSILCTLLFCLWIFKPVNVVKTTVINPSNECGDLSGGWDVIEMCQATKSCKDSGGRLNKYENNVGYPKFECDYSGSIKTN